MRYNVVTDWIWPTLEVAEPGYSQKVLDRAKDGLPNWSAAEIETHAQGYFNDVESEAESESDRRSRVEGKLNNARVAGFAAVTIAVALVSFLASGKSALFRPWSVLAVSVPAGYVALQLAGCFMAAHRGLAVAGYMVPGRIVAKAGETTAAVLFRRAVELHVATAVNTEVTNKVVSQRLLAWTFLRNAAFGIVVTLAAIVAMFVGGAAVSPPGA
jgi:hypothetical protein